MLLSSFFSLHVFTIHNQVAIEFKRPVLMYLNTYQLNSSFKFHMPTVEKAINDLLDEHFTGHKYNIAVREPRIGTLSVKPVKLYKYRFLIDQSGALRMRIYTRHTKADHLALLSPTMLCFRP